MKNTDKISDAEHDLIMRFDSYLLNNKLSAESKVQLIELIGNSLRIDTISNYAKTNNLSYNGVKNHRNIINLFGCKFVIE